MRNKTIILSITMIIVLILFFSGCSSNNMQGNDEKVVDNVEEEAAIAEDKEDNLNVNIMKDFRNMVENHNEPIDLIKYIEENIEKVSPEER